uniref:Uncharacterized protein n=1 Tax=Arundo donax TaxID=35708 RepID=A0A0A9H3L5_ARUDO
MAWLSAYRAILLTWLFRFTGHAQNFEILLENTSA